MKNIPKLSRRKEIVKTRNEINETENRNLVKKKSVPENDEIDKPRHRLKEKKKNTNNTSNINNKEGEDISYQAQEEEI